MQNTSQKKNGNKILDGYSEIQQGPLVGRGNEVISRAEDIKDDNDHFDASVDSPPLDDLEHGDIYGKKEYHGI